MTILGTRSTESLKKQFIGGEIGRQLRQQKGLGTISVCILLGILGAGLWPFNPYLRNEVSWLVGRNGLRFGDYGMIQASRPLHFADSHGEVSCSLEVWLQPAVDKDQNTFLAFYTPENPLRFELQQYLDHLLVLRNIRGQQDHSRISTIGIAYIFRRNKKVFITVTSGPRETAVYIDGRMVKSSPRLGLTKEDLAGQLIFGTSPVKSAGWRGNLLGLALYDQELTGTQVAQNYQGWIQNGRPPGFATEGKVALYLFEEHTGSVVHNSARWGPALSIPEHFKILQKPVLARPREKDFVRLSYWKDVLLNIGGFIPFGFFVCAYLSSSHTRRAALAAILVGAVVSLTIEILQIYIPTRDSDTTDLVANTSGAILGVLLYRSTIARAFLASLHRIRYA